MKRHIYSTAVLGVMVLLAFGSVDTDNNRSLNGPPQSGNPSPKTGDSSTSPDATEPAAPAKPTNLVVDNAIDVLHEYESNEVRADAAMKNKLFAVRGKIDSIGKDILGTPYVVLKGEKFAIFGVQCMFSTEDEPILSRLSPGNSITIAGVCSGKFGSVIMRNCWIYDEFASKREKAAIEAERQRKADAAKLLADAERSRKIEQARWRKWLSKDGGFSTEAKFVSSAAGVVTLEKKDGKVIKVEMSKLSDDDRRWIESQAWLKAAD